MNVVTKRTIQGLLLSGLVLLMTACVYHRTSVYAHDDIKVGVSKEYVLQQLGKPFKQMFSEEEAGVVEVLCYKESVYVGAHEYILSTYYYFKNNKLFEKDQKEEAPPCHHSKVVVE
jgi:hypothetical protein